MKYIINLGDFNVPNYEDIKKVFNLTNSEINVCNFIKQANGGDKRSQLKDKIFESFNLDLSEGKNIFLINNNLSHEVSALTSAVCFRNNGKDNNRKIIINFDKHKDYVNNQYSSNTPIQYSNWGKCIHRQDYRNFIDKGKDYIYLSTDEGMSKLEGLIKDIQSNTLNTDLYVTIDTDVYKESCTSYGDGDFDFDDIYEYIRELKNCTGSKVNFCGADVTGCADTISGYYNINDKRTYLYELTKQEQKSVIDNAVKKVQTLLNFFETWN